LHGYVSARSTQTAVATACIVHITLPQSWVVIIH